MKRVIMIEIDVDTVSATYRAEDCLRRVLDTLTPYGLAYHILPAANDPGLSPRTHMHTANYYEEQHRLYVAGL
jgi:hypothetical protein